MVAAVNSFQQFPFVQITQGPMSWLSGYTEKVQIVKPVNLSGISKFSSVPESEHERLWRNTAVAKIYGANSAEIARRLFFVGMNIEVSTPGEQGYNDFAFSWFEKSYVVARAHDYNGVALDDLCQMALIKYDTKNPTSCLPYIVQASELISLFPNHL
jgi:hypothetical protein